MTSPNVVRCLDKAAECDRRAEQAIDEASRAAYRSLAENWRFLAENHRRIGRMEIQAAGGG